MWARPRREEKQLAAKKDERMEPTTAEIEAAKNSAWNAANRDLREQYRKDWETHLRRRYAERGLEWNPRPSKEDREQAQLEELIKKYPEQAALLLANPSSAGS
jgi:hypothetical protein